MPDPPSRSFLKPPACGPAVESQPQAGLVFPAPRRAPMSTPNVGPGLFEVLSDPPFVIEHVNGDKYAFDGMRKITDTHLEGRARAPGSVLIGWAGWLLALIGAGALFASV